MSLALIDKLPSKSFNLSSTVFKAVREIIKTFDINTFQALLISWTFKGHNLFIYYSIFNFSQASSSLGMIHSNRLIYRDKDKTLLDSDITSIHSNIISNVEKCFNTKLRD